jgi:hypothetical protein
MTYYTSHKCSSEVSKYVTSQPIEFTHKNVFKNCMVFDILYGLVNYYVVFV